ncbi:B3/B4 domain-containing protein [Frigidibacter sp. ROC022]|uniref:B3/B4 domain-containing protein n=1 Tax=Frigidibacter sp. ROC022 TaxID=2971796 RepID=UPI00215ACC93|nr:phenylalanine--tRNA ligase beta subunit-related protein [Frigidibacter sp. ROC022]MCR8723724.1 phenylalanine--tRNA ligase beta subunit-related protein [Frigidibacter sp. ROC022]
MHPIIAPEIFTLRPDFVAISLSVRGARNGPSDDASEALLARSVAGLDEAPWADAHLDAWRDAYRAFGAKPKRTPCSAEALRKRARKDGRMRALNAVVDIYNAISLEFAIPVGGEDAESYDGRPRLCRASGQEPFHTTADGRPVVETPDPGEVIWRDDAGVTCRRWNWRQGPRTQITEDSRDMWFVLERLDPMPQTSLLQAGQALTDGLRRLSPDLTVSVLQFDAANPSGLALSSIH